MTDRQNTSERGTNYDFVLCLDKTNRNLLIDGELPDVLPTLRERLTAFNPERKIVRIRLRFIFFGDYKCDCEPMIETQFFDFDTELEEMLNLLVSVKQGGGGDLPESSLEALALALGSECNTPVDADNRLTVVMLTDAPPHPLWDEGRAASPSYPTDIPGDLDGLRKMWENEDVKYRRLLLFAPSESEDWETVSGWKNVIHRPIIQGCYYDLTGEELLDITVAATLS